MLEKAALRIDVTQPLHSAIAEAELVGKIALIDYIVDSARSDMERQAPE